MADGELEIRFEPNPTQRAFIVNKHEDMPFGVDYWASRVREGKSAALAWSAFYHANHNPGSKGVMIRDTWENLQRTTLQEFFKWFPNGVVGEFHQSKKLWTWAEGTGAIGTLQWFGMDDAKDAGSLQSMELGFAGMDEVAPAEGDGGIPALVFDLLLTRMNQPQMNWRSIKMASNNPDESHWSYERLAIDPPEGFHLWQATIPENEHNLPDGYYGNLRKKLAGRPDLIRRFLDGKFGFQQQGRAVTPQFNEDIHAATGLYAVRGPDLVLCWDFGLNPTCLITQVTPLGHWNILEAFVGDEIGVEELIADVVKPVLASRYRGFKWYHVGDPAGNQREQSSAKRSAVRSLRQELGGVFYKGPSTIRERINPLQAVLTKTIGGTGVVQIDKRRARAVYSALRGGWHYKESAGGVISNDPVKDIHSHPGDALSYGASKLFPMGRLQGPARIKAPRPATFFGAGDRYRGAPKTIAPDIKPADRRFV